MGFALSDDWQYRAALDVIEFANLHPVVDSQVYAIADRWGSAISVHNPKTGKTENIWSIQRLAETGEPANAIFAIDQQRVRKALTALKQKAPVAAIEYVRSLLSKIRLQSQIDFGRSGLVITPTVATPTGVESVMGLGLAVLFTKSLPYGKRIKQCARRDCGLWFISDPAAGRPSPYCCDEHRELSEKEHAAGRQRVLRHRRALERGKKQ